MAFFIQVKPRNKLENRFCRFCRFLALLKKHKGIAQLGYFLETRVSLVTSIPKRRVQKDDLIIVKPLIAFCFYFLENFLLAALWP